MMKQTITTTTVQTTTITSSPKPASRADRIPKKSAHQIDGLEEEQSHGVFHRKPTPSTPTTTTSLHCSSPVLNRFSHTSEVSVRSSPLTISTRTKESNNTNQLKHPTKPHELPQPKQYQPQQQNSTTENESDSKIHLISSPFSQIHWIRKVKYLEKMKHYDEAIVALLFAMSESTERSIFLKLYLRANIIYNQLKDNDAALRTFNTCTRLYDNIIGLFARAILYLNTEKYEESLNDFDQLVCEIKCLLDDHENDPTLSFKYTNLLLTAMCCKANLLCCHMAPKQVNINSTTEHQQEHEDYKNLIESNSLFKQGLDLYDESLSIDSSFPLIYFYRGSAFRIFNIERTLQDYERAIRIQPDAMLYTFRAALYEDSLCNYRLALLDYNKAIEWEPNEPSYYLYRGHLYTSLMNNNTNNEEILSEEELDQLFQLAIADYTTCIELSEWNDNEEQEQQQQLKRQQHYKTIVHALNEHWLYSGLCSRGKLYENRNDTNKALQDFNRAIEIDCREPKAYVLRAMLYKSLNENGMSRSDMQIAMQLEDEY